MSETYIILIGAMKSGTTTLFKLLADHPQIAPARNKEPGFFAFEEIFAKGFDWYHDLFDFKDGQHCYRMEASTDYTKRPFVENVIERMQSRHGARYKLIYIMRHPIRRLESHARFVQHTRKELGQNISPRPDHSLEHGVSDVSLATSRYAYQLDPFRAAFPAEDLHILTLETLRRDPKTTLAKLYRFLEIDPETLPEDLPAANTMKSQTKNIAVWKYLARTPVPKLGRYLMPNSLRTLLKRKAFRTKATVVGRFAFLPEEEERLKEALAEDIARLQEQYGIDVKRDWDL